MPASEIVTDDNLRVLMELPVLADMVPLRVVPFGPIHNTSRVTLVGTACDKVMEQVRSKELPFLDVDTITVDGAPTIIRIRVGGNTKHYNQI